MLDRSAGTTDSALGSGKRTKPVTEHSACNATDGGDEADQGSCSLRVVQIGDPACAGNLARCFGPR